jgi:hypothetical protein
MKRDRMIPTLPGKFALAHGFRILGTPRGLAVLNQPSALYRHLVGRRVLSR